MDAAADAAPPMSISVRLLSGAVTPLEARPETSVGALKQLVQEALGIFTYQQKLLLNGVELQDTETLARLNVESGAVLTCMRVSMPTKGQIEGRWCNEVEATGQFSVGWDFAAPDQCGLRIMSSDSAITSMERHGFRDMTGLGMNFSFDDVLAFVFIFVSGSGVPVMRGAFGSSHDTGTYHGGFEEATGDPFAAAAGLCPRSKRLVGEWRDNEGGKGKMHVSWNDHLAKAVFQTSVLHITKDDRAVPLGSVEVEMRATGLKVKFTLDGSPAVLEIFASLGDQPVFVGGFGGGYMNQRYGTFHGGFEELETQEGEESWMPVERPCEPVVPDGINPELARVMLSLNDHFARQRGADVSARSG